MRSEPADREFRLAFWKLHILHHAAKGPVYGLWLLDELAEHGHRLSPGTLYPLLARMEANGWLESRSTGAGPKARREYRVTPAGRRLLDRLRVEVDELHARSCAARSPSTRAPLRPGDGRGTPMRASLDRLLATSAPPAALLIRLMVGGVFLSEGIQKLLHPATLGAGRFAKIGIPWPEVLGPTVAGVEIACGTLVLVGLLTRLAAVPLTATMLVAIVSTKPPIPLGRPFWGFSLRQLPSHGFWAMAHEARTDRAMLLGSPFLLWVGAGPWSADARLRARRELTAPAPGPPPASGR